MIKAVLFDLDGTAVDTRADIANALNFALKTDFSKEEITKFVGNGLLNAVKNALKSLGRDDEDPQPLYENLVSFYTQHPYDMSAVYDGMIEFIDFLHLNKISFGIFSNKDQKLCNSIVDHCFGNKVDFVAGRLGLYSAKPDPEAVFAFCNQVGCSKDELLYVGDSEVDYKCACNAGVPYEIVTYGFRTEDELINSGIKKECLVSSIEDLLAKRFSMYQNIKS